MIEPHILIKDGQLYSKNVQPKVLFVHTIYHMSRHFCPCVGASACDCMPLLKEPVNVREK